MKLMLYYSQKDSWFKPIYYKAYNDFTKPCMALYVLGGKLMEERMDKQLYEEYTEDNKTELSLEDLEQVYGNKGVDMEKILAILAETIGPEVYDWYEVGGARLVKEKGMRKLGKANKIIKLIQA